jgi:uncharacterized protein YijF (DUF1287 family)
MSSKIVLTLLSIWLSASCQRPPATHVTAGRASPAATIEPLPQNSSPELKKLLEAAIAQVGVTTSYDPTYVGIDYPGGDVPIETGVCSDVLVRAFRKAGLDLQQVVHEDMKSVRIAYPNKWGSAGTDPNIDHRRVLNLMTYFGRKGKAVPITSEAKDYLAGDIVAWDLGGGIDHIGLVTNLLSDRGGRRLIVHNIGAGTKVEDRLFDWKITGHYRYFR